jgi:gamma-glutamyltranspeptidase/glutathione hydrolase
MGLALGLFACGTGNLLSTSSSRDIFTGGAIADEPLAALAARDVLAAGGSAADAVVAAAFTLAVTLPSSAGIGGGGSCLVWDRMRKAAQLLDLAGPEQDPSEIAVPGLARLLFALHARFGRTAWGQLVQPAETLARTSVPVSRALSRVVGAAPPGLLESQAKRR